jgi:uncharacterized membrane protein
MRWQSLPGERIDLPLVVVVRPVDSFLGRAPVVPVEYRLELEDPAPPPIDASRDLGGTAVRTASGRVVFPSLRLPTLVPETYHLRPLSPYLVPDYPPGIDAFVIRLLPGASAGAIDVLLHPGPAYPYPAATLIAHGEVREDDRPASAAMVTSSAGDRCATDSRGRFSLALRAVRRGQPVSVIATTRSGQAARRNFPDRDDAVAANIAIRVPTP